MKILFIVPSYKPAYIYGGPIICVARLAEGLAALGHTVVVYTTTANGPDELDVPLKQSVMMDGVDVRFFKRITKDHTHASPSLWAETHRTAGQFDVVHIHSWWNFLVMGAVLTLNLKGIRPVLTPHGMLCDFVFQHKNNLPKKVLHTVIGKYLLSRTYLHVTAQSEWDDCLNVYPKWEGEILPNLIGLPEKKYARKTNDVFTVAFLSRIHPKKGIDILIKALAAADFPWKLQIGGSGDDSYVAELQELIRSLNVTANVEWAGWKDNDEKFAFLAGADLFALTSHNENFALVVVESLAVGTPVLISNNVGLAPYVEQKNMGWVTGIDTVETVKEKLTLAYNSREERLRIQEEGSRKVHEDFNEIRLSTDYVNMYRQSQKGRLEKKLSTV